MRPCICNFTCNRAYAYAPWPQPRFFSPKAKCSFTPHCHSSAVPIPSQESREEWPTWHRPKWMAAPPLAALASCPKCPVLFGNRTPHAQVLKLGAQSADHGASALTLSDSSYELILAAFFETVQVLLALHFCYPALACRIYTITAGCRSSPSYSSSSSFPTCENSRRYAPTCLLLCDASFCNYHHPANHLLLGVRTWKSHAILGLVSWLRFWPSFTTTSYSSLST